MDFVLNICRRVHRSAATCGCLGDGKRAVRPVAAGVLRADGTGDPRHLGTDRRHPGTGLHRSVRAGRRRERPRPGRRRRLRDRARGRAHPPKPAQTGPGRAGSHPANPHACAAYSSRAVRPLLRSAVCAPWCRTGRSDRHPRTPWRTRWPVAGLRRYESATGSRRRPRTNPSPNSVTKPSTPSSRPSPGPIESRPIEPAEAAAIPAPPRPTAPRTSPVAGPRPLCDHHPRRHDKDRLPFAEKTASDMRPLDPRLPPDSPGSSSCEVGRTRRPTRRPWRRLRLAGGVSVAPPECS